MATFEIQTAKVLKSRILHTRSMADFYRNQTEQQESVSDRYELENIWHLWLRMMDNFVDLAKELYSIEVDVSKPIWSQVLQELNLIIGE